MRLNQSTAFTLGVALIVAAFLLELIVPLDALPYLIMAIFIMGWVDNRRNAVLLGVITTPFIITGYFISLNNSEYDFTTLTNRLLSLGLVWLAIFFKLHTRKAETENEYQQERVNRLTADKEEMVQQIQTMNDIVAYEEKKWSTLEHEVYRGKRLQEALTHNFPEGVVAILGKDMKFITAGGEEFDKTGYYSAQIRNDHVTTTLTTHPDMKRAFTGETVFFELDINSNTYAIKAVPLADARHAINEVVVLIRNISERKKLEHNLRKTHDKVREANEQKLQFVTMASHKFRTPLSTILSSVFLIENDTQADEAEKKSYLDKIKRSVHNLTGLLNDFLSVGKLEEGKIKASYSELDIKAFFDELLEEISSHKKAKQRINLTYACKEGIVITDKLLLKNILSSLLLNAIEYSYYDADIQLEVELKDHNLRMKVADQGIGIPEHEQQKIFKRFYRGENARNNEGIGLGLNIAKKYVKLLKGSIEFTSKLNIGSTFIVNIPVATVDVLEKQV